MLTFYGAGVRGPIAVDTAEGGLPVEVNWVDAFDPTPDELSFLKHVLGIEVPSRADLEEIESSSRLSVSGRTIAMSFPAVVRDETGYPKGTPIGLLASDARLVTLRFDRLPSFEILTHKICAGGALGAGGFGATITVLEVIVDHIADNLENIGKELDATSRAIFADGLATRTHHRPRAANDKLKELLRTVGRFADVATRVSESLLGLSRIPGFITAKAQAALSQDDRTRLDTIAADARSLHEYQEQVSQKTQFLLDTLLGLANIEQNNVFRVLTVVSVIGIPPTFFASMYGMNFKTMPEYDWTYGYPYGLAVIIVSALIPAVYFKVRGWW